MAFRREGSDPPVLYGGNLSSESDLRKFAIWESIPFVFELDARYNRPIFGDEVLVFMLFVKDTDKFLINAFKDAGKKLGQRHRFAINTLKQGV